MSTYQRKNIQKGFKLSIQNVFLRTLNLMYILPYFINVTYVCRVVINFFFFYFIYFSIQMHPKHSQSKVEFEKKIAKSDFFYQKCISKNQVYYITERHFQRSLMYIFGIERLFDDFLSIPNFLRVCLGCVE